MHPILTGGRTMRIRRIRRVVIDLHPQILVEQLVGSGSLEQLQESGHYALPPSSAKLLNIAFQKLLEA